MVEISDLIISIDLHAVMVLVLCSCNAELQLLKILNLYFYCIKLRWLQTRIFDFLEFFFFHYRLKGYEVIMLQSKFEEFLAFSF